MVLEISSEAEQQLNLKKPKTFFQLAKLATSTVNCLSQNIQMASLNNELVEGTFTAYGK